MNSSTLSISSNSMFHKHELIDDEILTILTRGITLLPSLSAFIKVRAREMLSVHNSRCFCFAASFLRTRRISDQRDIAPVGPRVNYSHHWTSATTQRVMNLADYFVSPFGYSSSVVIIDSQRELLQAKRSDSLNESFCFWPNLSSKSTLESLQIALNEIDGFCSRKLRWTYKEVKSPWWDLWHRTNAKCS